MSDLQKLVDELRLTDNVVTAGILRLIIEKRVLRGEAGRMD